MLRALLLCVLASSAAGFAPGTLQSRRSVERRTVRLRALDAALQAQLDRQRFVRDVRGKGLAAGSAIAAAAVTLLAAQHDAVPLAAAGIASAGAYALRPSAAWLLARPPRTGPCGDVEVRSAGPAKGDGLFATSAISEGAYLLDYLGEALDEEALYARFGDPADPAAPIGGPYVFELTADTFVDGADPALSNLARYMNHAPSDVQACNVRREKVGGRDCLVRLPGTACEPSVRFWAARDIAPGEELCFDYGEEYWLGKEAPV